jgi:hypothetical protein
VSGGSGNDPPEGATNEASEGCKVNWSVETIKDMPEVVPGFRDCLPVDSTMDGANDANDDVSEGCKDESPADELEGRRDNTPDNNPEDIKGSDVSEGFSPEDVFDSSHDEVPDGHKCNAESSTADDTGSAKAEDNITDTAFEGCKEVTWDDSIDNISGDSKEILVGDPGGATDGCKEVASDEIPGRFDNVRDDSTDVVIDSTTTESVREGNRDDESDNEPVGCKGEVEDGFIGGADMTIVDDDTYDDVPGGCEESLPNDSTEVVSEDFEDNFPGKVFVDVANVADG